MKNLKKTILIMVLSIFIGIVPVHNISFAAGASTEQTEEVATDENEGENSEDELTNPVIIEDTDTPRGLDAVGLFDHAKWWAGIAAVLAACLITVVIEFRKKQQEAEEEKED